MCSSRHGASGTVQHECASGALLVPERALGALLVPECAWGLGVQVPGAVRRRRVYRVCTVLQVYLDSRLKCA